CSDRIFAACWSMLSINPDCVDSRRGAFEYVSSTGRVRNRQPVVGSTARSKVRTQKGELRLMKYWMTPRTFEYTVRQRVQNKQVPHPPAASILRKLEARPERLPVLRALRGGSPLPPAFEVLDVS